MGNLEDPSHQERDRRVFLGSEGTGKVFFDLEAGQREALDHSERCLANVEPWVAAAGNF